MHEGTISLRQNMNSKLQNLANSVGLEVDDQLNAFAQLIVSHCAQLCSRVAEQAALTNTGEMARKTNTTAKNCAELIKEVFGDQSSELKGAETKEVQVGMRFVKDCVLLEVVKANTRLPGDWFCRSVECDTGLWSYDPSDILDNLVRVI